MEQVVVRNAVVWVDGRTEAADVAVADGEVVAVGPELGLGGAEIDACGRLLLPGLVDTHLHLDKAYLSADVDEQPGSLQDAIARTSLAKWSFTAEEVHARAVRTLNACVLKGTTVVRTHVEIDPSIGLRGLEGVLAAADEMAWAIDVQLCVFPQEGLALSPETEDLLTEALKRGATAVGGAPYTDTDPQLQIDKIFELARTFDVDVDLHLDLAESLDDMQIGYVCRKADEFGWGGRVTVGHVTQLSLLPPDALAEVARRVADSGVAVTSLPSTDLYLMGRSASHSKPRGVAPLNQLHEAGVVCSIATNNVRNSFTPYGDCSLLRMANLYANVAQLSSERELAVCLSMVTDQAAAITGELTYGIVPGYPADMVLFDTTDPVSAVAEMPEALWAMKAGRLSFTRPPVELHRPEEVPAP